MRCKLMTQNQSPPPPPRSGVQVRILRMQDLIVATGMSRATIFRLRKRREFPQPVRLSPGTVGWRSADVDAWLAQREAATVSAPDEAGATDRGLG